MLRIFARLYKNELTGIEVLVNISGERLLALSFNVRIHIGGEVVSVNL